MLFPTNAWCRSIAVSLLVTSLCFWTSFIMECQAIECYECHGTSSPPDYRPDDAPTRDPLTGGFPGSHRKHMDATATPSTCTICHPGSDGYNSSHRNGLIAVSLELFAPAAYRNGSTNFPQTPTPKLGSCTNVSCHSDGTAVVTGTLANKETPVWGSGPEYSCSACHGNPPSYGNNAPKANSHLEHPYSCNRCHYATTTDGTSITNPSSHRNWNYDLAGPPGEGFGYDYTRRCYNTYCHGNGTNVATGAGANSSQTPQWGTSGPLGCSSCHSYPPAYAKGSPKANAHLMHNNQGYRCSQCHYNTTRDGTTLATGSTSHANRTYDVAGPPDKPITYAYNAGGGSCVTYCHSTAQGAVNPADPPVYANPSWNESYIWSCRNCHKAGYHVFYGFAMDSGSHLKHLQFISTSFTCKMCHYTPQYGNAASCDECHRAGSTSIAFDTHVDTSPRGPEHANGVIDVAFHPGFPAGGATGSYSGDPAPRNPYGACSNLYCHSQGTRVTAPYAPANIPVVAWGGTLPADCTGCHGGDLNSSIPLSTGSHDKHLGHDCSRCHSMTAYSSRSAMPNRQMSYNYMYYTVGGYHGNGAVEVGFNSSTTATNGRYAGQTTPTINMVTGTRVGRCTNVYCHTSGTAVVTGGTYANISTPVWGRSGALQCGSCHGYPPAYQDGDPKGNGHLNAKHDNSDCKACHYTVTTNNTSISDRSRHAQHRYEVSGAPGNTFTYAYSANGSSCSNVACHTNGAASRDWGTSCTHCHGNPPSYPNYNPKANSHTGSHLAYGCQSCHYSVTTSGKWITNATLHNNGRYDIAKGPGVFFTYTSNRTNYCANVSCHSDGTSVVTGVQQSTGTAYWGGSLYCRDCHGADSAGPNYPNGSPKANSHYKHGYTNSYRCQICHYAVTTDGNSISTPAKHKNGQYDVSAPPSNRGFTYTYNRTGGTCAALYCHTDGTSVITGSPVSASATWGGPSYGCNSCHGYPPAYASGPIKQNPHLGSHQQHACKLCHSYSSHANGSYEVYGGPGRMSLTYAQGNQYVNGGCSNIYCHSDGTAISTGIAVSNAYIPLGAAMTFSCTSCHGMPPAYTDRSSAKGNAHGRHTGYGCQTCHSTVTADGVTISDKSRHGNGFYNVTGAGGITFNYSYSTFGSSCSNISCHSETAKRRNWTYQALDVTYVYPGENTSGAYIQYPIQLAFAEDMDPSTINGSTFMLSEAGTPVAGVVSYDAENRYALFTPTVPLKYYASYTATYTTGIKNAIGIPLSRGKTWSFTTGHSSQFDNVLNQSFPNWTIAPFTVPTGSWTIGYTAMNAMSSYYAIVYESWGSDAVLQSASINLADYQTAELLFSYNLKYSSPNVLDVDVSVNGSDGPWVNVWRRSNPPYAGYGEISYSVELNLTALLSGQQNAMIRFRLYGAPITDNPGWFAVDNIMLYADHK